MLKIFGKKVGLILLVVFIAITVVSCAKTSMETGEIKEVESNINMENLKEVYFAGGCFWGVEEYFSQIPGVYDVVSGYANGNTENPSYEEVCRNNTGHAETVKISYNPEEVSLKTLTEHLFKIINPISKNRQGNDVGTQYRTGVYYTNEEELPVIQEVFDSEQQKYEKPIVTELTPLENFYKAEEYHQDYLKKNPDGFSAADFNGLHKRNIY